MKFAETAQEVLVTKAREPPVYNMRRRVVRPYEPRSGIQFASVSHMGPPLPTILVN